MPIKKNLKIYILAVIALAVIFGAIAYSQGYFSSAKSIVLPEDIKTLAEKDIKKIQRLPEEEKNLLAQYYVRSELIKAFGNSDDAVKAVTVGDAIESQKEFIEEKKQQSLEEETLKQQVEKRRQAMAAQFSEAMVVTMVDKALVDENYSKVIALKIAFQNKSAKDIAGVKGIAIFSDIFGDEILKSAISIDDEMPAGKTTIWDGSKDFNQFDSADKKFAYTEKEKVKFEFQPEVIIFKDGTKIDVNEKDGI